MIYILRSILESWYCGCAPHYHVRSRKRGSIH